MIPVRNIGSRCWTATAFVALTLFLQCGSLVAFASPQDQTNTNKDNPEEALKRILSEYHRQQGTIQSGVGRCKYQIEIDDEVYVDADADFWFSNDRYRMEFEYRRSGDVPVPITKRILIGDPSGVSVVTYSPNYRGSPCRVEIREDFNTASRGMQCLLHKLWRYPVDVESFVVAYAPKVTFPSGNEILLTSHQEKSNMTREVLLSLEHSRAVSYRSKQNGVAATSVTVEWSDQFGEWYPKRLQYESPSRGRRVRDTVEVVSLELNAPFDEALLRPGTLPSCGDANVMDWRPSQIDDGTVKMYKQDKNVAKKAEDTADLVASLDEVKVSRPAIDDNQLGGLSWVFKMNLLLLGLIGIYAAARTILRRGK